MKDEEMLKPLQPKIAAKLMLMAAALTSSLATGLVDFCLDNCDGVWEVACSLTAGLARRVNSKDFDLVASTWRKGMTSTRRRPGKT